MNDVPANPHEQWEELAAGYALHALEPDEELRFTEHLRTCSICADVLRDHELVAAQLAALAHEEDAAPPAWNSVRQAVVGADQRPAAPVVDLAERRRRRQPRILGAAAALVVLAGAAVTVWHGGGSSTKTSPAIQAVQACQKQPGCSVVRLHTPDGAAPGIVLVSDDHATMLPTAMAPAPTGKTYVLWQLLRNGGPTAVASFADTRGEPSARLVMPYDDTAAFAVSVEPAGLPPSQPTHVVAVGNTSA
jgi:hypothetical protein